MNTGITFSFWKGQRFCRKKIIVDKTLNTLHLLDIDIKCKDKFPDYYVDDCGTYYDTYRLCAIRDYALDVYKNQYSANETYLKSNDNICPINKLEFKKDQFDKVTLTSYIKNLPDPVTGIKDNKYFTVILDWIKFQGYESHLPSNYSLVDYHDARWITINKECKFGWTNDMRVILDTDDFMDFYDYSLSHNYYYKGFMEDENGNYYRPFITQPVTAILTLFVTTSYNVECYNNVWKGRGETKLLGLPSELDVSDLFGFVLTIAVWTFASVFLGLYSGLNIRFKIIISKYISLSILIFYYFYLSNHLTSSL